MILPTEMRSEASQVHEAFSMAYAWQDRVARLSSHLAPAPTHCQVPCGIFDDPATVAAVNEACATIRKAMVQINELGAAMSAQNFNQMTRWVNTKEEHADKIIALVSEYSLCQRVKPVGAPKSPFTEEKDYVDALTAHHKVMQAAMKAKQTVDVAQCDALEHAVGDFAKM